MSDMQRIGQLESVGATGPVGAARPARLRQGHARRLAVISGSPSFLRSVGAACAAGGVSAHAWPGLDVLPAQRLLAAGFGVVLLDQSVGALSLVRLVRELGAREHAPRVLVLGDAQEHAERAAMIEAGADMWVSKAIAPAALILLVRELLNGNVLVGASSRRAAIDALKPAAAAARRPAEAPPKEDVRAAAACLPSEIVSLLTPRELETLRLVASGMTNVEVAAKLWVTHQTVKFHLRNIYRKLDVANRTQASNVAHRLGLLAPAAVASVQPARRLASVA
jgi:DNA-binding NarL/FixJ family response regulator